MLLKLTNNVTKKCYEFTVNDNNSSRNYYRFEVTLPSGMDDGEYEYNLYDDEKLMANGLLQIGDYNKTTNQYSNNGKTYKQYNG